MGNRRPRRGGGGSRDRADRNILVAGGEGEYHPQGSGPTVTEEGDLGAREFGVPQADLPGGVRHIVNPQQPPIKSEGKPERPADYHKYHGVQSDDGPYVVPEADVTRPPAPPPAQRFHDAVPVYIVTGTSGKRDLTVIATDVFAIPVQGSPPVRICDRDPNRRHIYLLNESSGGLGAIGSRFAIEQNDVIIGKGALLPTSMSNYLRLECQDELWMVSGDSNANKVSVLVETVVPAAESGPLG